MKMERNGPLMMKSVLATLTGHTKMCVTLPTEVEISQAQQDFMY